MSDHLQQASAALPTQLNLKTNGLSVVFEQFCIATLSPLFLNGFNFKTAFIEIDQVAKFQRNL